MLYLMNRKIYLLLILITFCTLYYAHKYIENKNFNEPLVSVIMPVYNAEEFLDKSVSSVINQTYKNLEILLIDDCSTDNSYNILKEYANKDNRIKLFHNEQNKHVSATRNVGIKNATGKYLYFIDSDDFIDNDYIEHLVKTAEKENADIVVNVNIYEHSDNRKKLHLFTEIFYEKRHLRQNELLLVKRLSVIWNRLYKREIQQKYNIFFSENIKLFEDAYFDTIMISRAQKIAFSTSNSFYHYTKDNKNSITKDVSPTFFFDNIFYVITRMFDYFKKYNLLDKKSIYDIAILESSIFEDSCCTYSIKQREENYQKVRNFILNIKNDILLNKNLYLDSEIDFINNIEKYTTYKDYKKYYNSKTFYKILFGFVLLLILIGMFVFTIYKLYIVIMYYIKKENFTIKNLDN